MRLLAVVVDPTEAEVVGDRAWQAGAAGIWEQARPDGRVELRVGTDDPAAVTAALAAWSPVDVTDRDAVELASRTTVVTIGERAVTVVVPPTVFGDGSHPTTQACVELLTSTVTPGDDVLDVGCGSGITSLAAALAGGRVHAIDIDPVAAAATAANAATLGVEVVADTTPLAEAGSADVVVANISTATILALRDELERVRRPAGALVVSGMLDDQWPQVRRAFADLEVVEQRSSDGWTTALLRPGTGRGATAQA